MAKGFVTNERIEYTDAVTGVRVIQLTSYPTPSVSLFYANTNFTPDSEHLILLCQRAACRGAPWDLFSVRADGSELRQVTDADGCGGFVLSPDGRCVYYHRQGALWRTDMEDLSETRVCEIGVSGSLALGFMSPDGVYYFTASYTPGNGARIAGGRTPVLYRVRTDGSEVVRHVPDDEEPFTLHSVSPGGHGLLVIVQAAGAKEYRLLDYEFRPVATYTRSFDFAHSTFLGRSAELQGCGLPPEHALFRIAPDEEKPRVVASGPYFWHSCSTLDGEWIVADTNWPDLGLHLVHVPTGRYARLCMPRSSQGHPQWTHPHPQFSPDGRCVVFTSDATGIPQVYLARVTDEMRQAIIQGELSVETRRR